ncbi:MAG: 7TM diverse intracellular signaling domain-containing protein [Bacteroidia bacterium]|nr:7TM diverse intracellular signaling domain-containing protein [Bacteroidia bacterium]
MCITNTAKGDPIHVSVVLSPANQVIDLQSQLNDQWFKPQRGKEVKLILNLKSEYSDSASFIILPGNWDKIWGYYQISEGKKEKLLSGHFIPDSWKAPKAIIFYDNCIDQRMGLQNQLRVKLPPNEETYLEITALQFTDLDVRSSLIVRPLSMDLDLHGPIRVIFHSLFLGIILVLFIYHLIIFLGSKEPIYLYYSLYMVCLILHSLDYNGLISEFILDEIPNYRPNIRNLADNGIVIFYLLLLKEMTNLKKLKPAYDKWVQALIWIQFINLIIGTFILGVSYEIFGVLGFNFLITAPGVLFVFLIAPLVMKKGDRAARYFICGSIFLAFGNLLNAVLFLLGFEGTHLLGYFDRINFFQLSTLIELACFSFALAMRTRKNDLEQSRIKAADQIKSRLFRYLFLQSRAPLTLILGPTQSMLKSLKEKTPIDRDAYSYYLKNIQIHAGRLQDSTDQLLELTKIDEGRMKVNASRFLLKDLLDEILRFVQPLAKDRGFELEIFNEADGLEVATDREKLFMILDNLIKRAFIDLNDKGKLRLGISTDKQHFHINVWNTGQGVSEKLLKKVFNRFHQFQTEEVENRNLTGIRLAVSYELSKILGGKLEIDGKQGEFTSFTLSLPLGTAHIKAHEWMQESDEEEGEKSFIETTLTAPPIQQTKSEDGTKASVLIVDNDRELRNFIAFELQKDFQLYLAENGEQALALAEEHLPDLIVSDIKMPGLTGFDLSTRIKKSPTMGHIPVLLLSGEPEDEVQLNGYQMGADAFLLKPFHPDFLKTRIHQMIHQRRELKEKYLKEFLTNTSSSNGETKKQVEADKVFSAHDQEFINKVRESLDLNLKNTDYGVSVLAEDANYERRQLTRKIKEIFEVAPGELIRNNKINIAKDLLMNTNMQVIEIALEVGYKEVASFRKAFKDLVGKSPTQFRKNGSAE